MMVYKSSIHLFHIYVFQQLRRGVLITPNVSQMVKLQKYREFYDIVKRRNGWFETAKSFRFAPSWLGTPLREAIPGSGFFPHFYMDNLQKTVGRFGGLGNNRVYVN